LSEEFAVTVDNLVVSFGSFMAVKDVSFKVRPGEIFGFLGANGAGKTTTIRVLCGLLPPTSGNVVVAGKSPLTDAIGVKERVGYMSQKFTLYHDMTISENLVFTGKLRHMSEDRIRERIDELVKFIELDRSLDIMVSDLPAGVLQQVALVAATIHDPEIVFLDEPTAGVTPRARSKFWELIRKMSSAGKTVFVTTHYMDEAEECGRVALMRSGELIALDSPADLKKKTFPDPIYEITPEDGTSAAWCDGLRAQKFVAALQVFGMRYHALVTSADEFEKYMKGNCAGFGYRRIDPSLEDVFIRLVEGANR
jgi:ABC-2 type transport system ATP-binding protein